MPFVEQVEKRQRKSRTWQDSADPTKFASKSTIVPLHYESVLDSGNYDTPLNLTPNPVNNTQLDGWTITSNGWHYALGIDKLNHPGEDGWFGFGGRQGSHWLKLRLERVGYLRYSNLAWTDLGGLPTYTRSGNLSQTQRTVQLPHDAEPITVETVSEWRNLYATPGGGEVWIEIQANGDRLKVNPVINQAGRDYVASQYPGTPAQRAQYYFGYVFRIDHSDIPRAYKNSVLQDLAGDFDDDDGSESIELRDALDRLLAILPVDNAIVRDHTTGEELDRLRLRKRIYQQNGNTYLLVGARVDFLQALPPGDLVFDPTVSESVGASGDDGYWQMAPGGCSNFDEGTAISYMGWEAGQSGVGDWWRFTDVLIESGATITTAHLVLMAWDDDSSTGCNLTLYAEDGATPAAPSNCSAINARTPTTAQVAWSNIAAWTAATSYNSADISTVIQELYDSYSANYIAGTADVLIYAVDNSSTTDAQRQAASIDNWLGYDSPGLYIEYTAGGGGDISGSVSGLTTLSGTLTGIGNLTGDITTSATASSTLLGTGELVGEISASSSVSSSIIGIANAIGAVSGSSTVGGTLLGYGDLASSVSGISSTNTTLVAVGELAGSSEGTSTELSTLIGLVGISSSVSCTSTVSGTLIASGELLTDIASAATVLGTLVGLGTLLGSSSGTSLVSSTLSGLYGLEGSSSGVASLAAILLAIGSMSSSTNGIGTVSGTILASGLLSGSISGIASDSSTLHALGELSGSISGVATLLGTLLSIGTLSGTVGGSSNVAATIQALGNLIANVGGDSTVSGLLVAMGELVGSSSGVSTVSGTLINLGDYSGFSYGTSTVSGTLVGAGQLAGLSSGLASIVATISGNVGASGTISGISTVTGTLLAIGSLSGDLSGFATLVGSLLGSGELVGSSLGTSTATANTSGSSSISGSISGLSTVSGTIAAIGKLLGSVSGSSTIAGTLASLGISGTSLGTSLAIATLVGIGYITGSASGTSTAIMAGDSIYDKIYLTGSYILSSNLRGNYILSNSLRGSKVTSINLRGRVDK